MDVISYSKAVKAKKRSDEIKKRLGLDEYKNGDLDVTGQYDSVKARLESLEGLREGIRQERLVFETNSDFEKGVLRGLEVSEDRLKGVGTWEKEIDLGEDAIELGRVEFQTVAEVDEGFSEDEKDLNKSYSTYENDYSGVIIETDTGSGFKELSESQVPTSPFKRHLKIRMTLDGSRELDRLIINYRVRTIWDRISNLEKNISINLNKHNLRVNSVLNQSAYKLTEMVFDDFHNESGIDKDNSSGYFFDSSKKIIKIDPSKEKAEIILKPEEANNPTKFFISLAINEQTEKVVPVSFEKGFLNGVALDNGVIKLSEADEGEYMVTGFFESPIVDLGTNLKRIKEIISENIAPPNSELKFLFKTSKDGNEFTEYKVSSNITSMDISDRYIQVKLEFYAALTQQPRSLVNSYQIAEGVMRDGETISIQSLDKMLKRINDISNDTKNLSIPFFYNVLKRKNNVGAFNFDPGLVVKELGYLSIKGQYI
ncbi:hypothetical protein ABE325_21855 [Bacillus licheniformis]